MRRPLFIFLLLFFLLTLSSSAVFAQIPTGSKNGESLRDRLLEMRQRREEVRKYQAEKREQSSLRMASKQAQLKQKVVERIKRVFENILGRLNATLARLDKISERIATRIDKLKAKRVDTSRAELALIKAEGLGSDARAAIDNAEARIKAIDTSETSGKEAVFAAKEAVKNAKLALFEYHKGLVAVIVELKASADLKGKVQNEK